MSESSANESELRVLGVKIDNLSREEIDNWIKNILGNPPEQKFVTTLNPEIILKARRDKNYKNILNSADLNLCDGFGIKFISWLKGKKIKARYTGVDLTGFLLKLAREKNLKVLVVVSKNSLSSPEEIRRGIEEEYNFKAEARYWDSDDFFESERVKTAQIVFANFGVPQQEKFLSENRVKFPEAKFLAGVGGTFDFLTGRMKRAPKILRSIGLEWLWRFVQEPKRIKRIWNAVAVFPFLVIFRKN